MNVRTKTLSLAVIAAFALMGCGKEAPPPPPVLAAPTPALAAATPAPVTPAPAAAAPAAAVSAAPTSAPTAPAAMASVPALANQDPIDVDAAKALAKKNDCFKCHAVNKTKKGPSFTTISEKYKGKADGEEKAIHNMTSGNKVKLEDGTEEDHKIIDTKDPKKLKNLAQWILSH